jgi:antitoxin (DNA-binding transcriptional repressor) of toxin-antitoxin stability system
MKTATVREVQHHLSDVLAWVENGEEVRVLRRKKVVARILPPEPVVVAAPDFVARAKDVWGGRPRGKRLSEIVSESRGRR